MSQSSTNVDWIEWMDTQPEIHVQDSEYQRLLGYPPQHVLEGRARELMELTRQWYAENGKPWVYTRQIDGWETSNDQLRINGARFSSKLLHDQFSAANTGSALLVVVSAGRSCEERARELWQESKPDEYFFMEMYGSAVVEHLITAAGARICDWAERKGMAALPHYSPGYSGWDVSDQNQLWDLICHLKGREFPEPIRVLDSGMLHPKKSLLALFGITRHPEQLKKFSRLVPCENCSFSPCQYRRAPYRHSLPQIEDVRRLQADFHPETGTTGVLDVNAKYSINSRALQKWSQERLRLKILSDGSVEARFRYEGTTCANLGQPLEFHYDVKLGSAQQNYRILDAVCAPAQGDTGYTQMCEYLSNGDRLMKSIADEKPLLGKPVNEVLTWKRNYNPSGCYCDIDRRAHKWGLVYEVIHYALAQYEKELADQQQTSSE